MSAGANAEATLALLWERVRRQGDMPGFGKAIGAILGAMRGEEESEFDLTRSVLSDPVLTQKVLRLANSGMYAAFGQRITTVSKAVLVLGPETVGHLALGLKLIEELSSAAPAATSAHVEMEKAVLAGMVAHQVATSTAGANSEEAVVCSMLHPLGRMMLTYYLPERWADLQAHGGAGGEDGAAQAVLGLSVERIGLAAAEHWGLPSRLIDGMRRIDPAEAVSGADWLAGLATMAAQCADSLWEDDAAGALAVRALALSFSTLLGVAPENILQAVERARVAAVADLSIAPLAKPAQKRAQALATTRLRAAGSQILVGGLAEMGEAAASATPSQMMSMALETLFQGLTLTRAIAFQRNRRERHYGAKMGFGEGVKEAIADLRFPDAYEPNVFHAALDSDRVIFIENAADAKFAAKLPPWWKAKLGNARSFVILPLCIDGQAIGFIYGDWDASFPPVQLSQAEFGHLNALRGLVVRSVERRQRQELAGVGAGGKAS